MRPVLALLGLLLAAPSVASACGGFFCNGSDLVAVDQTKERILFEVNGDGTITAHVEITYTGRPAAFSWVIPVPDTPDLEVVPASTLRLLDAATSPRVLPPGQVGDFDSGTNPPSDPDDDDGVKVEVLEQVGPFDPTVVSSDDPEALADWLNTHGYLITEEMRGRVAHYVQGGMKFLAMKLAPDAEVSEIAPIKMTYPGDRPMVPLILSGVAAEPDMGILVFIAADRRYEPSNWASLAVHDELLRADPRTGETNYYGLLSWLADQEDGLAFFTEFSDATDALALPWIGAEDQEEAEAYLQQIQQRHPWITRLYTRISNYEMVTDPSFAPTANEAVSNVHDLSGQPPVNTDFEIDPDLPCNERYCGDGGACATTADGGEGCVCDTGFGARAITVPRVSSAGGLPSVSCQDLSFDMMASLSGPMPVDPCEALACGSFGSCTVVGGFGHCVCEAGYAAVRDGFGGIVCAEAEQVFAPNQLLWPDWPTDLDADEAGEPPAGTANRGGEAAGCSAAGGSTGFGLLLLLGGLRRRF